MEDCGLDDLSLLQLAALAEEFVWGHLSLSEDDRERLRRKLIDRFAQVEALNRVGAQPAPR